MKVDYLPASWATTELGEFAAGAGTSVTPKNHPDEVFDLYSVPAFEERTPDVVKGETIKSNKQRVEPGDVLLCKIVPHLNRVWTVEQKGGRRQIASGEWVRYDPAELDPGFLCLLLSSPEFREEFMTTVSSVGGSPLRARPQLVNKITIPVAPIPEQRRIVAKLDRLSARSRAARDHLARTTTLAARAKQAILAAAFDPKVVGHVVQLDEIAERVTKGASPRWQGFDYQPHGILFVRSQNVGWGHLLLEDKAYLDASFNQKQKNSVITAGDVLLNIVGASIGRSAVATHQIEGANCNQAVAVIKLADKDPTSAQYLNLWLWSEWAQNRIHEGSVDVARANFSLASIKALALPWPGPETRASTVRRIESAFARIDRLTEEAGRAAHLLDHLDERLLARAFRGELVPQDPTDEPAAALLTRIRTARAATPSARRTRKKTTLTP